MQSFLSILMSLHLLAFSTLLSALSPTGSPLLPTQTDPARQQETQAKETADEKKDASLSSSISSPSAVLMEASTGTILFEKDSHKIRHPASITKIMTLILIFDALKNGSIHLSDTVTVSEHAASMGGSQVFLEAGETQDVETMIKCISIASANDACVAFLSRRHFYGALGCSN